MVVTLIDVVDAAHHGRRFPTEELTVLCSSLNRFFREEDTPLSLASMGIWFRLAFLHSALYPSDTDRNSKDFLMLDVSENK